jgi:penicillin amidase
MSLLDVLAALNSPPLSRQQRLSAFPTRKLPLRKPVTVYWNEQQVPFIDAQTDTDLAFTLGLVHGHLRGGQLVLMKHVALGRLSEMAGPWAVNVDHAIRILGFDRAAEASLALMAPDSRAFLEAFVAGLNHQQQAVRQRAPELALLGVREEPWTAQHLLAIGRLAGADINWFLYFSLLGKRQQPGFAEHWQRLLAAGGNGTVSFRGTVEERVLSDLLTGLSRSGSNSVVVGPERTASGHAMIANDPHLGLSLPNVWLLAGMRSPSWHMVGMMVPGLPFLGLGRSPRVAWGGTNMRAASSDLVDVSGLPPAQITTRQEVIGTRFWLNARRPVRQTPFGPVLSDAALGRARNSPPLALRWMGHDPSDEIGAFLKAAQASDVLEFRAAFANYGVSGLNVLCADDKGNIGQLMAVTLPARRHDEQRAMVQTPEQAAAEWTHRIGPLDLPWALNPPEGFITSANNRPAQAPVPVGFFFSGNDRIGRLQALLAGNDKVSVETLRDLQTDTLSPQAAILAASFLEQMDELGLPVAETASIQALRGWDGRYEASAQAPVLFETLLYHLVRERHKGKPDRSDSQWEMIVHYLLDDLDALTTETRRRVYRLALHGAAVDAARYPTWGDMHRLVVGHLIQNLPFIGRRFVSADLPASGSRETPMKTAHGLVNSRHQARYGSQARQISDLGDMDANWFVLLGGQDGWLGSANYADQIALWQQREYIRLPLRLETVKAEFGTVMELLPDAP